MFRNQFYLVYLNIFFYNQFHFDSVALNKYLKQLCIDAGMKFGCGHPMGPLELLDFVGLDTAYYIANIMYGEFKERRFSPPPLLRRMVQAGRLGRKSGRGFYDYSS